MRIGLLAFLAMLCVASSAQQRYSYVEVDGVPQIDPYKVDGLVEGLVISQNFDPDLDKKAFSECKEGRIAEVLLAKINAYRAAMGKDRLKAHAGANAVAQDYAKLCADRRKMDHRLDGTTPSKRMKAAFPNGVSAAENLFSTYGSIQGQTVDQLTDRVLKGWIRSSGHHKLLLSEGGLAAVGIARNNDKGRGANYTIAAFNIIYRH